MVLTALLDFKLYSWRTRKGNALDMFVRGSDKWGVTWILFHPINSSNFDTLLLLCIPNDLCSVQIVICLVLSE